MILLAALVRLPLRAIAAFGLVVIAGHNLVDPRVRRPDEPLGESGLALFWQVLYFGPMLQREGSTIAVLYSLVPWVGVMAAGYAFGAVLRLDELARRRWCIRIGVGAIALFLALEDSISTATRDRGRNRSVVSQHDQVPGLARLSADDARPDDSAGSRVSTARVRLSHGRWRSSGACRSSSTCFISR